MDRFTTYRVSGMTCNGCAGSVERALARVGIEAEVSAETHTARVLASVEPDDVQAAVEAAGFGFEGVEATA